LSTVLEIDYLYLNLVWRYYRFYDFAKTWTEDCLIYIWYIW